EFLNINGTVTIAGSVLVTMNGPGATIWVNNGAGLGTVEIKGLFHATMLGSSPVIIAGDSGDSGTSLVKFDSGVTLLGSSGGGATFEKEPGVTVGGIGIVPVFFTVVSS